MYQPLRFPHLLRQILEITDRPVVATDLDGLVIGWNVGAVTSLGWTETEMLGHSIERIFTSDETTVGRLTEEKRSARRDGGFDNECRLVRKDGTVFQASSNMTVLRDEAGAAVGLLRLLRDHAEVQPAGTILKSGTKVAEAAARDSEERYRTLFNNIDAGFCVVEVRFDDDGRAADYRFVETNPAFEQQTGLVDAAGKWMRELAPAHEQHWFDIYGRIAMTGQPSRFENPAAALDDRWYDVHAFRIGVPEARRVAILFNDISQRRRAEQALQHLNGTLERQVEQRTQERDRIWQVSHDMLGIADQRGVWQSVNPAWTRILGWSTGQIVGRNSEWLGHPDDREKSRAELARLQAGLMTLAFENRFRTMSGDYRTLNWTAVAAENQLYCVARDVTKERERDRALRDSEDFTRLALSAVDGVGVWTYDVSSDRFFCDAAIARLHGLDTTETAAGITREAFLANVNRDDLRQLQANMTAGLVHGGDREMEYRIRHPDRSVRWVLSRCHTYFDAAGNPTRRIGVGIETTRQHQLEEQLRQSQKMEAVGQLTGGLAHDFNNLLTGIAGSLELLQRRIAQGRHNETDRYVTAAQGAADRAAALTHRLLAFSRRQTLDPRPTNLNDLVTGMEDMIRRTVGPEISLEIIRAPGLWTVLADPSQLDNALLNLCINARDAMPDGGRVTVETSNHSLNAEAARERGLPPGEYICLRVSDTGTGMSSDVIAKAFDPFFTTKPLGEGTGLGLSMIYGFARQSGGQVLIDSEVGRETTVRIYLPRHLGKAEDVPVFAAESTLEPHAGQGRKVLVVDDEPTVRMLVTEMLDDLGYTAIEAADAAGGLEILRSDVRIDLLVTDVGLPGGMNGRQMADAARVVRPRLKVLFITGYAEGAVIGKGNLPSGMHVLTKPFGMEALATRIKDLVITA